MILLLLKMKTIVMTSKVASTSTARMATIAPATNSPRLLFETSDTPTKSWEPVVAIDVISSMSPGSVASMMSTVARGGPVCLPFVPVTVAMLLGVGVGSFVGLRACLVVVVVPVVNCWETVVVVNIEDVVVLGVMKDAPIFIVEESEEEHG